MNKKKAATVIAAALVISAALIAVIVSVNIRMRSEDSENGTSSHISGFTDTDGLYSDKTSSTVGTDAALSSQEGSSEKETASEQSSDPEETTDVPADTQHETLHESEIIPNSTDVAEGSPIAYAGGLQLVKLSSVDGAYPEDGSNDPVKGVMAATFMNITGETLRYAAMQVVCADSEYVFEITTVPPGESVVVFDKERRSAPAEIEGDISLICVNSVYFESEPSREESSLEITITDGTITVKNISDTTESRDISVFYKNKEADVYYGGITYRVRITDELKPGQSITGYTSHAIADGSVVMFIQYDS